MFSYSRFAHAVMKKKAVKNQMVTRRKPLQERSQQKIELILEAATRILDREGLSALTTNRIAEVAGISIGTLYQYFSQKNDILVMLGQREMQTVTNRVVALLSNPDRDPGEDPARMLIQAVFGAFGGRSRVHRVLLENALMQGSGKLLDTPPNLIANLLTSWGVPGRSGKSVRFSPAQAFVITQAFVGVTRATVSGHAPNIPKAEIEEALLQLIKGFLAKPD